jgi:hypothetical protein
VTLFLRLLEDEDKAEALCTALRAVAAGAADPRVFETDPEAFVQVPGAPFAYWVSDAIRKSFADLDPLETDTRVARQGGVNGDDFRWLRLWTEVSDAKDDRLAFVPMAKGGAFSIYYADIYLSALWEPDRNTFFAFVGLPHRPSLQPASFPYYFRPGLTWPRRTNGLSFRAMPAGCLFADKGPAAFVEGDDSESLLALCALVNSAPFGALVALQLARTELAQSYEVGVIQQIPVPPLTTDDGRPTTQSQTLSALAHRAWSLKYALDTTTETSHAFLLPALLQVPGEGLGGRAAAWAERLATTAAALAQIQRGVDDLCFELYGIAGADRGRIEVGPGGGVPDQAGVRDAEAGDDDEAQAEVADAAPLTAALLGWALGVASGRFDARLATGERAAPGDPSPFDSLPICAPGMLQGDASLPIAKDEGSRMRDEGQYPLDIAWDGILVDDPEHPLDIERRIHDALAVIWGDRTDAIQQEACALLGVPTLRDWFRRPAGFFADHLKRYSKSRRQAPIYWPVSSPGGRYSLWLYYHRFSKDTLYRALEQVKEKVGYEERRVQRLTADVGSSPGAAERAALADQESLVTELRSFHEELARVAPLWNPNLNDGVILNYGPLWRMIGHTSWQKAVKEKWEELVAGKYDWAHLAMHLWPERVVPKCAQDRSLAIAHGLEAVFWEEGDKGKWVARTVAHAEVDRLIAERTSAAVKDALKSLLDAPAPVTGRGGGRKSSGRAPVRRAPTTPRSDNAGAGSRSATGSVAPDPVMLDAVKQAIAAAAGGTSKSEVLAATGLSDAPWNIAINALLSEGTIIKTGAGRGTRYHLNPEPRTPRPQ